jgi:hypothetical protein
MPDNALWMNAGVDGIDSKHRAVRAWMRILRHPTEIVVYRSGVARSAQTVRIELSSGGGEQSGDTAKVGVQSVVVYGIQGHPTELDTDLARGDKFVWSGKEYEITTLLNPPGEVQAFGDARS